MNFADGMRKAYETRWSYINTFNVKMTFAHEETKNQIGWTLSDDERLNIHVVSIDTPQFANQPIEVFVANKWVIQNGRDELYRFSITFRDYDQMKLYRKFVKLYQATREDYFDHVKMTIQLAKEGDWYNQAEQVLFDFENTIVESVSQLQFNNTTENQIAEFTVNFKTTFPNLKKFEANEYSWA